LKGALYSTTLFGGRECSGGTVFSLKYHKSAILTLAEKDFGYAAAQLALSGRP
jgi:hypothetical protein